MKTEFARRSSAWTVALVTVAMPVLLLSGCRADKAVRTAATIGQGSTGTARFVAPPNAGTIKGTVIFAGTPPPRVTIDMSMDPGCAMTAASSKTEQIVVNNGKLANVYLYIKSGIPASKAPWTTAPVVLDQKGCRYEPHVIAVQQGGTVEFKNSDPTMHNVHIVTPSGRTIDVSQGPMGASETRTFNTPAVMVPIRCNNHPWMNAFLNVAPNHYFAVTGADGTFTIKDLPPGTYTLAAVQEKLGEQDMTVTVPANGTAKADFSFKAK